VGGGSPGVSYRSPFALAGGRIPRRDALRFFVRNVKRDLARLAKLSLPGSIGETPQPAAAGSHSKAGMGHCREETMSNSNFLGVHSGLEQAHEARRGPQLAL
jgi:hypothetical protein